MLLAAVLAGGFLLQGIRIRAGRARSWQRLYWNERLPRYYRKAPLTFLAIGVIIVVALAGVVADRVGLTPWGAGVTFAAVIAFIALVPVLMRWPPSWLKPAWLRAAGAELVRDPARRPSMADRADGNLSERDYRIGWAFLIALVIGWATFSWPPVVLIGVGLAGVILYADRPR